MAVVLNVPVVGYLEGEHEKVWASADVSFNICGCSERLGRDSHRISKGC